MDAKEMKTQELIEKAENLENECLGIVNNVLNLVVGDRIETLLNYRTLKVSRKAEFGVIWVSWGAKDCQLIDLNPHTMAIIAGAINDFGNSIKADYE